MCFNLKADPKVVAANNLPVDDSKFDQRLKELERDINTRFGEFHPVAKISRLGMKAEGKASGNRGQTK